MLPDGGLREAQRSTNTTVRVEVADGEITWHTSDAAYKRLHYHLAGHLATEIESNVPDNEGDLLDVIMASSGPTG